MVVVVVVAVSWTTSLLWDFFVFVILNRSTDLRKNGHSNFDRRILVYSIRTSV